MKIRITLLSLILMFGTSLDIPSASASVAGIPNQPIVGMAATPSGSGYWLVASDGGIFSFGDAKFLGSTGDIRLNQPIVGMAATPSGSGYWLVASDGGIFSFGDAKFLGSTGDIRLNQPIVGMAAHPSGKGYWFVAADGGMFSYGTAQFFGSTVDRRINQPIVGMAATPSGSGYWLIGGDGVVYSFGGATFHGNGNVINSGEFVALAKSPSGYWLTTEHGNVLGLGQSSLGGVFVDTRRISRTLTYSVATRGTVRGDVDRFRSHASFTLNDPRSWSRQGTRFVEVSSGGDFTLWLSQNELVPSFGGACSTFWSCRSGNNVIVNDDRWTWASPSWHGGGGSLRDYRHMVTNHEVGHRLGHGHLFCSGTGALAPVMQQQSMSLQGCRLNPWPLSSEV